MEVPFHRQRQAWRYGLEERPPGCHVLPRRLRGLLTAVPSGSGSSVCWRMMDRWADLRLALPFPSPCPGRWAAAWNRRGDDPCGHEPDHAAAHRV